MEMRFIESGGMITLRFGNLQLQCTLAEFLTLEPGYPGLPPGIVTRQWTPGRSFLSDGWNQQPNTFDCRAYVINIANYQARLGRPENGLLHPHPDLDLL